MYGRGTSSSTNSSSIGSRSNDCIGGSGSGSGIRNGSCGGGSGSGSSSRVVVAVVYSCSRIVVVMVNH